MAEKTDDLLISISTDLATVRRSLKRLESDISSTTSNVQKQFDGLGKGIDKSMTSAMQTRINAMVGIGAKATKEWTGALSDQGAELERLRGKFNPVFSTITRYKATVAEIQQAHRLGAISADEMTAAISRERQATLASVAALKQRNAVLSDTPVQRGAGNFNTANIAAQFQDIGVTAAMGMSPLQIALQQGTQLSAVFSSMGNAKSVVAGLGAAFASIISPVSLVTIGVVGLTAAALQYFSTFMSGSEDSAAALKAQADLIQKVADKWGEALPSIKAYADEQQRIAEQKDVKAATANVVDKAWADARTSIGEAKSEVDDLVGQLARIPDYQQNVVELQRSFNDLTDGVANGKTEAADLERVSAALASLYQQTSIPVVDDLADRFANLSAEIAKASQAAALAESEAALAQMSQSGGVLKNRDGKVSNLGRIDPLGSFNEDVFQTNRANATQSKYLQELEKAARARSSGSSTRLSDAEREKKAIDDVIASLQFEQEQIGRTATEQRIYNELKRAGVDLNSEAGKQIAELVAKNAELAESQAKLNKAQQDFNNGLEQLGADAIDALGNVIAGTEDAADAFKKLGIEILKSALTGKGAYSDFFASLSGGQGGGLLGLLGGLFGPAQSSFSFPAGAGLWSDGGYTGPGGKYDPAGLVHKGEYVFDQAAVRAAGGPAALETFRQSLKGYASGGYVGAPIAPRIQSPANQNAPQFTFAPTIDARGASVEAVARLEQVVARQQREFSANVVSTVRKMRPANVKV